MKERRMVALDRENRKGKEKGLQGDKTSKGEETDKKRRRLKERRMV